MCDTATLTAGVAAALYAATEKRGLLLEDCAELNLELGVKGVRSMALLFPENTSMMLRQTNMNIKHWSI